MDGLDDMFDEPQMDTAASQPPLPLQDKSQSEAQSVTQSQFNMQLNDQKPELQQSQQSQPEPINLSQTQQNSLPTNHESLAKSTIDNQPKQSIQPKPSKAKFDFDEFEEDLDLEQPMVKKQKQPAKASKTFSAEDTFSKDDYASYDDGFPVLNDCLCKTIPITNGLAAGLQAVAFVVILFNGVLTYARFWFTFIFVSVDVVLIVANCKVKQFSRWAFKYGRFIIKKLYQILILAILVQLFPYAFDNPIHIAASAIMLASVLFLLFGLLIFAIGKIKNRGM